MGEKDLLKAFNDGREYERVFQNWRFEAVVGKDEPVSASTYVNGVKVPTTKEEIRNGLRGELRQTWQTAKFKGKLSPRLKALLKNRPKPTTPLKDRKK